MCRAGDLSVRLLCHFLVSKEETIGFKYKLLVSRRGKGWVVGVGGLNTGSHLQGHFKTGSHPCVVVFFFWSVVQINEKYNVDYSFKCGGFRGFNANK